jgi:DNA-binding HxlR family transcriptional regulator
MNNSKLESLVKLVHYRWALPILSELHRNDGCKFVTLVERLKLSKDALSRTLNALIEQDLVMRNPGYGHPLRPEYILSAKGNQIGQAVFELMQTLERLEVTDIALKKWSLPIILVLQDQPRFTDILKQLPGLTTRALALGLGQLSQAKLLEPLEGISGAKNGYRLTQIATKIATQATTVVKTLTIISRPTVTRVANSKNLT